MNDIKIPTSFEIFGVKWNVVYDNKRLNDKNNYGECSYGQSTIYLSNTQDLDDLSEDRIIATFFHELSHAILNSLKRYDLSDDEVLVDGIGNIIFQVLKTAKYN